MSSRGPGGHLEVGTREPRRMRHVGRRDFERELPPHYTSESKAREKAQVHGDAAHAVRAVHEKSIKTRAQTLPGASQIERGGRASESPNCRLQLLPTQRCAGSLISVSPLMKIKTFR